MKELKSAMCAKLYVPFEHEYRLMCRDNGVFPISREMCMQIRESSYDNEIGTFALTVENVWSALSTETKK